MTSRFVWVAGHNAPGYLPDNPPETFPSFNEARRYIIGELQYDMDCASDLEVDDFIDNIQDLIDELDDPTLIGDDWTGVANNRAYFIHSEIEHGS